MSPIHLTDGRAAIDWTAFCFGCGDCCGPVPFERLWWEQNKHRALRPVLLEERVGPHVIPLTSSLDCVFLTAGKRCAVYKERPDVCRLYGTIAELACPRCGHRASAVAGRE